MPFFLPCSSSLAGTNSKATQSQLARSHHELFNPLGTPWTGTIRTQIKINIMYAYSKARMTER
jgi:hypothetical protein